MLPGECIDNGAFVLPSEGGDTFTLSNNSHNGLSSHEGRSQGVVGSDDVGCGAGAMPRPVAAKHRPTTPWQLGPCQDGGGQVGGAKAWG